MREHGGKMPLGILRTVVPAAPDAWITALERLRHDVVRRRRRCRRCATPAKASRCSSTWPTMIKQYEDGYRSWPSNAAIFLPGGKLPQVGDRFVQSDLAGTLQYMIDQERAAPQARPAGRASPPRAPPSIAATSPRRSCAITKQNGGYLARDDLANFHCRYEEPVQRALARLRGLHLRAVVPGPDAGAGAAHDRGGRRPEGPRRTTAPTTSISSPRS